MSTNAPPDKRPISVLWLTSGLGCDGDSIAMTSATSPSIEDLLRGCLPGMPPVIDPNDIYSETRAGKLSPVVKGFAELVYVPNSGSNTVDVIDPHSSTSFHLDTVGQCDSRRWHGDHELRFPPLSASTEDPA